MSPTIKHSHSASELVYLSEVYDKVADLKKPTVPQLKEHLLTIFEKESYSNLVFEKPDMGRIVSIEFSIEEMETR